MAITTIRVVRETDLLYTEARVLQAMHISNMGLGCRLKYSRVRVSM